MSKLKFDSIGERFYETGVKNVVLYPRTANGTYPVGVPWNGVTGITETPSGAEPTPLYADDIKYLTMMSAEELGLSIEAYTYPDEFMACDGTAEIAEGVQIAQQARQYFGLAYKTTLGNDTEANEYGYKLHLVYGCLASPSDKSYATINDTPDAITFSWDISTNPEVVTGFRPSSSITIDSTKIDSAKLAEIEKQLYGLDADDTAMPEVSAITAHLLLPNEIAAIVAQG